MSYTAGIFRRKAPVGYILYQKSASFQLGVSISCNFDALFKMQKVGENQGFLCRCSKRSQLPRQTLRKRPIEKRFELLADAFLAARALGNPVSMAYCNYGAVACDSFVPSIGVRAALLG